MDPERWRRIEEVFGAALDVAPEGRDALLAEACREDGALRREVEALLGSRDRAGAFMMTPAFDDGVALIRPATSAPVAGDRIGPYEIVREIGRGGMGAVYLASRADDAYSRRVAIKVIARGAASRDIQRRFRNERQILASLDHPNIARLLDGGATADGRPYFVMEHVEGESLVDYCDRERLTIEERLRLFRKICGAVHHAHQNLVVHRDLKPSNILVTAEGEPKLLDFGIAKLLAVAPSDETLAETAPAARAMTPAYASPEQVRGAPVTTASDVYALGVILYNLLAGRHPYRFDTLSLHDVERVICERDPAKPSDVVTRVGEPTADGAAAEPTPEAVGDARDVAPERLRRILSGDLDNIALMAMRKEPARRYASAADLSEDIRRYLEGLPVRARKDTFGYRAGKFVRRNKAGVAAAAFVLLALVGGVVATTWQARIARAEQARAERRFDDVRRLANSMLFEIHDSVRDLAGSTPTRRLLVTRALEYLDSLAAESDDDASLQRELAAAYEKVGDIQGNPYVANLGDTHGALESYRKALAIREALGPADADARRELAITHRSIGDVLEQQGDVEGCVASYRTSLAVLEEASVATPADAAVLDELARAHEALGDGLGRTGERGAQLEAYRKAVAIREELLARDPANARLRRGIAVGLMKLGEGWVEDEAAGIDSFRRSIAMLEATAAADPTNARARREVSMVQNRLGEVLIETGDAAGALEVLERAHEIRARVADADPSNAQASFDLAVVLANLADALTRSGRAEAGSEAGQRAIAIFRDLVTADPENMVYRRNLGLSFTKVALSHTSRAEDPKRPAGARSAHWREARALFREALDVFSDLRERGALRPADAGKPDELAAEVARCDEALARL
jgi:serine/threonine protein kinase